MAKRRSRELVALERRVGRWRSGNGGRRRRVPRELWAEAMEVAQIEGVSRTACATGLSYAGLKKRLEGARKEDPGPAGAFVAVEVRDVERRDGVTVDLARPDGLRMRIESCVKGVDLRQLVESFLGTRA